MELFRVIRQEGRTTFEGVRPLTAEEQAECELNLGMLNSFQRSRAIFPVLIQNAEEVVTARTALGAVLQAPEHARQNEAAAIGETINRTVVNFLTAMRLYLDHTATRLARTYGRISPQITSFETATAAEFDSEASYRMLYKLRNYVQHCGLPVDTAGVNSSLVAGIGSEEVHEVVVGASTKVLLETYDSWGKAREDIMAIGHTLRAQDHVPAVMTSLRRIEEALLRTEIPELLKAGTAITTLLRTVERDDAVPALLTLTDHEGGATMQFHEPPYALLEMLRLVRVEPDGRPVFRREYG